MAACAARLDGELARQDTEHAVVEITDAEVPVVEFLYQQGRLRGQLPLRVLHVCTTCRHQRLVNPDYRKLVERNRRNQALGGSVGLFMGAGHVSPYILVGRLLQATTKPLDDVCPRCQGLDSSTRPVTFCPRCGDRRDESVLRGCAKCHLDLRSTLPPHPLWREPQAVPLPHETSATADAGPAAGWFPDPAGLAPFRWWDGSAWTADVTRDGTSLARIPLPPPAPPG